MPIKRAPKVTSLFCSTKRRFEVIYSEFSPMQQQYALPSPSCDKVMNVTASPLTPSTLSNLVYQCYINTRQYSSVSSDQFLAKFFGHNPCRKLFFTV